MIVFMGYSILITVSYNLLEKFFYHSNFILYFLVIEYLKCCLFYLKVPIIFIYIYLKYLKNEITLVCVCSTEYFYPEPITQLYFI
jgi:hypothetical protein